MTLAEVTAELALVDAALTAAYSAQSYSIGGRNVTRASIDKLMQRKDLLMRARTRLTAATAGAVTNPIFSAPSGSFSDDRDCE